MAALVLIAFSLGLSNFAAAISIGVADVTARQRLEIGVAFGVFEAGMPVLGLLLGHQVAHDLGHDARWLGGAILIATGIYTFVQGSRASAPVSDLGRNSRGRLVLTALALSIDNLAIGFALGTRHLSLVLAAVVIGAVSVAMSLAGLELGSHLGTKLGEHGEVLGGVLLVGVGVAIASGAL